MLSSLKNLSLAEDSQPNYIRFKLEADDREFSSPPATHFIATVEYLTDMLDYGSDDIDGMDDDAGEEEAQDPPFTNAGRPLPRTMCTWWMHQRRTTTMHYKKYVN